MNHNETFCLTTCFPSTRRHHPKHPVHGVCACARPLTRCSPPPAWLVPVLLWWRQAGDAALCRMSPLSAGREAVFALSLPRALLRPMPPHSATSLAGAEAARFDHGNGGLDVEGGA